MIVVPAVDILEIEDVRTGFESNFTSSIETSVIVFVEGVSEIL